MKHDCGQRKAVAETAALCKAMKAKRNLVMKTNRTVAGWLMLLALATLNPQPLTAFAQPVTKIAAGYAHSLFLKSDGSLWVMGYNNYGQLGDGTANNTNCPEQVVASNVVAIAGGYYFSLFLENDGSLWSVGNNQYGQLGNGAHFSTSCPGQIVASNVVAIAAGWYHSLFLESDGSLWAMGSDSAGQLGDGTQVSFLGGTNRPELIVASNVTAIAAGYAHSLFRKSDGSLWAMGDNEWGQLGDGTYNQTNRPEEIVASNVTAIAAGQSHSLFLKSDGSLWAMGYNAEGQLGDPSTAISWGTNRPDQIAASNVTAIAGGGLHSLFVESDGSLWAMGYDAYGELGDGTYSNPGAFSPEQILAGGVTAIAAGYFYSLFIKNDGSLWVAGYNNYGQLGDGTYNQTNRPERIVANPSYNQISGQLLSCGDVCLFFFGIPNAKYALDRSFSLSPANWVPQLTNSAGSFGALVFTNTPDASTNNFWRIRSVP
jgi:alpha-tubulin suppressor-like RCC1 family protein